MSKKDEIKIADIYRMMGVMERSQKGKTLIIDAETGGFRWVPKDKFRSVGTIEIGWYDDEKE